MTKDFDQAVRDSMAAVESRDPKAKQVFDEAGGFDALKSLAVVAIMTSGQMASTVDGILRDNGMDTDNETDELKQIRFMLLQSSYLPSLINLMRLSGGPEQALAAIRGACDSFEQHLKFKAEEQEDTEQPAAQGDGA